MLLQIYFKASKSWLICWRKRWGFRSDRQSRVLWWFFIIRYNEELGSFLAELPNRSHHSDSRILFITKDHCLSLSYSIGCYWVLFLSRQMDFLTVWTLAKTGPVFNEKFLKLFHRLGWDISFETVPGFWMQAWLFPWYAGFGNSENQMNCRPPHLMQRWLIYLWISHQSFNLRKRE